VKIAYRITREDRRFVEKHLRPFVDVNPSEQSAMRMALAVHVLKQVLKSAGIDWTEIEKPDGSREAVTGVKCNTDEPAK